MNMDYTPHVSYTMRLLPDVVTYCPLLRHLAGMHIRFSLSLLIRPAGVLDLVYDVVLGLPLNFH